jgi:hypothetical protein
MTIGAHCHIAVVCVRANRCQRDAFDDLSALRPNDKEFLLAVAQILTNDVSIETRRCAYRISGSYEIQILDSYLKSRASATGQAEIRNYITTLQSAIDLRSLPPGTYQLAPRRRGEEWQLFPARIE